MKMFYLISLICLLNFQCSIMTGLEPLKPLGPEEVSQDDPHLGVEGSDVEIESNEWSDYMISCLKGPCEDLFDNLSQFPEFQTFEQLQKFINTRLNSLYNSYQYYCNEKKSLSSCIDVRKEISKLAQRYYSSKDNDYYPHLKAKACDEQFEMD